LRLGLHRGHFEQVFSLLDSIKKHKSKSRTSQIEKANLTWFSMRNIIILLIRRGFFYEANMGTSKHKKSFVLTKKGYNWLRQARRLINETRDDNLV